MRRLARKLGADARLYGTMRKAARLLLAIAMTLAVVLAIQLGALARAGGGNKYVAPPSNHTSVPSHNTGSSGGVHFYSGGSSSGSSTGGSPVVFVVIVGLVAAVLIFRWWASRRSGAATNSRADAPNGDIDEQAVSSGLAGLQARDPNFNQQVFMDRAQTTFFALQNAWMAGNLEPARIYLSDGIYQRWKLQVDQMLAQRKRNVLENLVIGGCRIAKVTSDPNFDAITVRVDASAADYEVDDLNRMVSGDRTARPFTEYWTLIRSRSARTRLGEAAQITQCPNCGAPVSVNESGTCAYCKATVTTGQFGWVLDNITQASQWTAAA